MPKIRTFIRNEAGEYRNLVQIDDNDKLIKIYNQDKVLGFPFWEVAFSLAKIGYHSADDFYNTISRRERNHLGHVNIREVDTDAQRDSEIMGLIRLAKYRKDNGHPYRDVIEHLEDYITEEHALLVKESTLTGKISTYIDIVTRASDMGYMENTDTISTIMDIESADKKFNLKLEDWLSADDRNFISDFLGIRNNINRRENFPSIDFGKFVPVYASK